MTLTKALGELYAAFNFSAAPAAEVTARFTSFLNTAQQDVIGDIGGRRLVKGTITFASVAAQAEYGLPQSIARILSIRDTANSRRLEEITESTYRTMLPNPATATGTPYAYAVTRTGLGFTVPVDSSADLYTISTSASDTQTYFFERISTNGNTFANSGSLNGTTGVLIGTAGIVHVTDFYLATPAVGTVTVRLVSGAGTVIGTVLPGQTRARAVTIALITTPSGALTYTVDYERDATDLVNATDEFPVPVRFSRAVVTRAESYEHRRVGDQVRYALAMGEYKHQLGKLNHYLVSGPDQLYIPGGGIQSPSILPGNWPWDGYGIR